MCVYPYRRENGLRGLTSLGVTVVIVLLIYVV